VYETLDISVDGRAATLTLNRPDKLNAMNKQMVKELRQAFVELDERDDVRVIILRCAGRVFCAGLDLDWSEDMTPAERIDSNRIGQKLVSMMEEMGTPIFAAIHGYALGGGLELALGADFIVAADDAQLGLPEITLSSDPPYRPKITEDGDPDQPEVGGVVPGWGGPKRLPERIGKAAAKQLMFTGVRVKADRALQMGLVNEVFPKDQFDEEVAELGRRIGAMNFYNLRLIKELVNKGYDMLESHPV
jgi:enoyl-CoA hydratase